MLGRMSLLTRSIRRVAKVGARTARKGLAVVRVARAVKARVIPQSAVIPYRWQGERLRVLLITSRRSGDWIVPKGLLEPEVIEVVEGRAEVRQVIRVGKNTVIAGSYVTDGRIVRGGARVWRGGKVIATDRIDRPTTTALAAAACVPLSSASIAARWKIPETDQGSFVAPP